MTLDTRSIGLLQDAVATLEAGFAALPDFQPESDLSRIGAVLNEVALRLQDNYPYPHPLYAGQMQKPPHPVARLAYTLALWINPNNHSLDGGRASAGMEQEVVTGLAAMFGWTRHLGHLCGGGTLANLEALWISGKLHPGLAIAASAHAHYTHRRLSDVLQLDFQTIATDARGKLDLADLEQRLASGTIGTVVATLGTTAAGALDPLPEILALRATYPFRLHVDAAYGGYFTLVGDLPDDTRRLYDTLAAADSIVVDPHKHGLQPYGCGCVLFKDPSLSRFYHHESPYTYFTSRQQHLGEIGLECSRPGAAAVALWATQRLLPLCRGGEFAAGLAKSLQAARRLYGRLADDPRFMTLFPPELDIVLWAPAAQRASTISARSRALFERAADADLHLALVDLSADLLAPHWPEVEFDCPVVQCLRSCLMKPEHLDWCDEIWSRLDQAAEAISGT